MTTIDPKGATRPDTDSDEPEPAIERPWIHLTDTHDVEAWIDHYNRDLKRLLKDARAEGCGVCFCLGHGGAGFMHTNEGGVLLDVTPAAEWVAPLITAATGIASPQGRIWALPDDRLTQLVLGLSSLIESTRMVVGHSYKVKKY